MSSRTKRMRDYTDSEFSDIIMSNYYMVDVLEYMGYNRSSGTMTRIAKERAEKLGLDLTHFKGQKGSRGGVVIEV